MRTYDEDDVKELNAHQWQTDLLKLNPEYVYWGPHEDYMWKEKDGWDSPIIVPTWKEFTWKLDELNECVNFYFSVNRESKQCETCAGKCYHPDAQWISESFYGYSTPFRKQSIRELQSIAVMAAFGGGEPQRVVDGFPTEEVLGRYNGEFRRFCEEMRDGDGEWNDKITEDEAAALAESSRVKKGQTADAINQEQHERGFGHDAINRSILIRARCERLGVPIYCDACNGSGRIHTAPGAHVTLTLWMIHPRKGASRGVEITRVEQDDLPSVMNWLTTAAERNAERFSKLTA